VDKGSNVNDGESEDSLGELRRRLGVQDEKAKPIVGAVGAVARLTPAEAYARHMQRLHDAGADQAGRETVKRFLRRGR
jgi:hypothetical protein